MVSNHFEAICPRLLVIRKALRHRNNGCICCTLRGDFIEGMQKVLKDVQARGRQLDGVLIETTGLADPSPIASTFFLEPFMQENYRLDAILGVCDAKHLRTQLAAERQKMCVNEASEQVAFADRLLLTKTDLCSEEELEEVEKHLKGLNPWAKVLKMKLKDLGEPIPLKELLDVRAFSLDKALDFDEDFLNEDEHQHDGGIQALGVRLRGCLSQEKLNAFFQEAISAFLE